MKIKIAIVGAGPAGLEAYSNLSAIPGVQVSLIEAGSSLAQRLQSQSAKSVINGVGGAGSFSDGKLSGLSCGTGLLHTNPYELRASHEAVIGHIKSVLPGLNEELDRLLQKIFDFLGDNEVSSESVERTAQAIHFQPMKLYPSVVLSSLHESVALIRSYEEAISPKDLYLHQKVVDIELKNVEYDLTLSSGTHLKADYVILAMGRFGSWCAQDFSVFQQPKSFTRGRLEFGVRVDIHSHPPLRDALLKLSQGDDMIKDPKLKLVRRFVVGGKSVECEFRTFCVCLPSTQGEEGYVVKSRDSVTGVESLSGSSSYRELCERRQLPHVTPGSNLGIMMRIKDASAVDTYQWILQQRCTSRPASTFLFDVNSETLDNNLSHLEQYFPKDLCYPLYAGVLEMIQQFSGQAVRNTLMVHAPCVEGTGSYPRVDPRTYQHVNHERLFVAGDMVGHTRGFLQALVMGRLVGDAVTTHVTELKLRRKDILKPYQSLFTPSFSYNKTLLGTLAHQQWPTLYKKLEAHWEESLYTCDKQRPVDIYNHMHRVRYTGTNDNMGVLYELHHFFLDADVYGKTKQLHYISQTAMLQYIMLCNVVEAGRATLARAVAAQLDMEEEELAPVFEGHQFKSCVLALRTRDSMEERDQYTDIPVMQSAFKLMPAPKGSGRSSDLEARIIAITVSLLDGFFKTAIEAHQLSLLMVRSKIETQEPAIESVEPDKEPLYLECHVKVNMMHADGSPLDYYTKKHTIQLLASLFEGHDALVRDIFKVLSVSINLLKHPEHGQQFFLTFRTDTKAQMKLIRRSFSAIMRATLGLLPADSVLRSYRFSFFTDAEFVIYDDNRPLDMRWFLLSSHFLADDYETTITRLTQAGRHLFVMTQNEDKMREIKQHFHADNDLCLLQCKHMELPPDSLYSLQASATRKVELAYASLRRPVIAESTGLLIRGGFPGARTKEVMKAIEKRGLLALAGDRRVCAETVIAYHDGQRVYTFSGLTSGKLVPELDGLGWDWDTIFVPDSASVPFSQMSAKEKAYYSMRIDALTQLSRHLQL